MAKRKMRFDKNGILIPEGLDESSENKAKADPLNLAAQQVPVISSLEEMDGVAELKHSYRSIYDSHHASN